MHVTYRFNFGISPYGSIGLGYFVYGKKQAMIVPFVCGLALIVYPFFMPNTIALALTGLALIAIPFFSTLKQWH